MTRMPLVAAAFVAALLLESPADAQQVVVPRELPIRSAPGSPDRDAVIPAPDALPVAVDSADRERMYQELQHDVAALDRELSIYKRVAQLVTPSVVHVEAT